MLTKAQIEAAQFWTHSLANPEIDRDLRARAYIDTALDAYQRVTALLAECEAAERDAAAKNPAVWKLLCETPTRLLTCSKLRRALEGK